MTRNTIAVCNLSSYVYDVRTLTFKAKIVVVPKKPSGAKRT